jgi:diadenosine tetraphosphate (Ap4A) HIT family hydrolase
MQTSPQESEFHAELDGRHAAGHFADLYKGEPPCRVVGRNCHLAALVDIAPLTPGHLLIVPVIDVPCFARLGGATWEAWQNLREYLIPQIERHWTRPTMFEHGSSEQMRGSACITHAHLHMVPGDLKLAERMEADGLEVLEVADQRAIPAAIGASRPYFYVESPDGQAHVAAADSPRRPSQYLRRIAADALRLPSDSWDWGVHIERARLRETMAIWNGRACG